MTPAPWEETQTQRIAREQETSCLAGGSPKAVPGDFVSPVHVQRNQREGGSVGCCLQSGEHLQKGKERVLLKQEKEWDAGVGEKRYRMVTYTFPP